MPRSREPKSISPIKMIQSLGLLSYLGGSIERNLHLLRSFISKTT